MGGRPNNPTSIKNVGAKGLRWERFLSCRSYSSGGGRVSVCVGNRRELPEEGGGVLEGGKAGARSHRQTSIRRAGAGMAALGRARRARARLAHSFRERRAERRGLAHIPEKACPRAWPEGGPRFSEFVSRSSPRHGCLPCRRHRREPNHLIAAARSRIDIERRPESNGSIGLASNWSPIRPFVGLHLSPRRRYRPQFQIGPIGVFVQHGPNPPPFQRP